MSLVVAVSAALSASPASHPLPRERAVPSQAASRSRREAERLLTPEGTSRLGVMSHGGGIGDSHGLGNQGIVEEGFEAAKTFLGARPGFVFKKGLWGVGYYPDLTKDAQPRRPHKPPDGVVRPSASRCHYEVLGVAMLADDDELRRAYRQLALKVRARVQRP